MRCVLLSLILLLMLEGCQSSQNENKNGTGSDSTNNEGEITGVMEIQPLAIQPTELPNDIKFKGKLQEAWQWKDKLGENILLTSYVAPYDDGGKEQNEDGHTAEVYAFHYVKKNDAYDLLWKMSDAEKVCLFDITLEYPKGSTTITDLDKDGIAETKIQYAIACRSDVSPANMKLIMHEDSTRYSLTGFTWLEYGPEARFNVTEQDANLEKLPPLKDENEMMLRSFGRYESEKEFMNAPPVFLQYARKEWIRHVKETFN